METDRAVAGVLRAANTDSDLTAHLNDEIRDMIDEHGEDSVRECTRLILEEGYTRRGAGAATFGPESYLHGLAVGSAVSILREEEGV